MARKLRVQYPGAVYHVVNRGDRREPSFQDDQDRLLFLETPGETCAKTDWQIHAGCLMSNHFHLVSETPRGNLVPGRQWLLAATHLAFLLQRYQRQEASSEDTLL
jgi:putative transposase